MATSQEIVERIERRLTEEAASARRAGTITLVVGLVLCAVLAGYLYYLRTQVEELAQPTELARDISTKAKSQLTAMRKELAATLTRDPDGLLRDGLNWSLDQVTSLRIEAETKLLRELDQALVDAKVQFDLALDEALENNEAELRLAARDLLTEEGVAAAEEDLYHALTEMYSASEVRYDIAAYAIALDGLAQHLEKLAANEDLTPVEQAQRDLVIALKELSSRTE